MSLLVVDVEIDAPARALDDIIGRLEEPGELLSLLGGCLVDYEQNLFATGGHGRWAPDDPATAAAKHSGRTLVGTGNLLRELTQVHIEGESVGVNAGDAYYARFLRDGDRGMPKRDPAPMPSSSDVDDWAKQLLGYIVEGRR